MMIIFVMISRSVMYAEAAGRRRRLIALAVPPVTIMAENYLSQIKTDYLNECCEEKKIIFGTLPRNVSFQLQFFVLYNFFIKMIFYF